MTSLMVLSFGNIICSTNRYLRGIFTPAMNKYSVLQEEVTHVIELVKEKSAEYLHTDINLKEPIIHRRLFSVADNTELQMKEQLTIERYKMEYDEKHNPERYLRKMESFKSQTPDISNSVKSKRKVFRLLDY